MLRSTAQFENPTPPPPPNSTLFPYTSMSTAAMQFRSPINSSSDAAPHSPLHSAPFNADVLNPSAAGPTARGRSRPRLAKLRKQSSSQHARSLNRTAAAAAVDEGSGFGFNPFRTDQVTGNVSRVESGAGACDGSSGNCHRRFGSEGFVFGAVKGGSDSVRDSNSEQKETGFRKSGDMEFVFSAERSDVKSNSLPDKGERNSENAATTVSGDERKTLKSEGEKGEFKFTGFVFSASQNNLASDDGGERECKKQDCFGDNHSGIKTSNFNVKKQEPIDSMRNSDHGIGNFNVETQTNSNCDDVNQCDHLGDDDKCKGGYGSTNGISATCNNIPARKLVDEINKLNINHSEGADLARDSINSCVNSSNVFVFGGSDKGFSHFSASSGTNTGGQQSCTDADFKHIGGQHVKACGTNDVQNGTACGIACGSTGIPCSKTSTSQEGIKDFQCGKIPEYYVSEGSQVNEAAAPLSSSADNDKCDNCFASIPPASKESFTDFKPPSWDPSCFKDNLFSKLNKKSESRLKSKSSKEKGSKYMRRKLKPLSLNKKQTKPDHLSEENSSLKTPDSSGSFSPMDFSPYQETAADDQDVKASEELNDLHSTIPSDFKDECLAAVGREHINTPGQRCGDLDNGKSCNGSSSVGDAHSSGPEIVWSNMKTEQFSSNSSIAGASAVAGFDFTSNSEKQKADIFSFVNGLGDSKEKGFTFSASSTVEGTSSLSKRKQKKKFRRKMGCDSFVISPIVNGKPVSSVQFSSLTTDNMSSHSDVMDRSLVNDQFEEGEGTSSASIQAACYQWRLRGNRAHKDGDLSKAEEFYTQGINSVPSSERSGCYIKPLLLCYSNRAATRMSLGRIREALGDCMMATSLDPTFLKVQMRAANCHLLLGEVENAQQCYNKCLESGKIVCLDRRVIVEAAEGLQKAQKVVKYMNDAAELLKERTSDAAGSALELLTKALSISLYSEKLLQMKAEALYLLQKYDAAIQLCEQSPYLAERNFAFANSANNSDNSMHDSDSSVKFWRWSLISKCYFRLGRLEASLNVIDKLQQEASVNDKCVIDNIEDLLSLAATIRELLDHKRTGNENFKLGKYTAAVENYTVALSSNIKSRPFAAICFGNRAAAYQALGQIADAIADCSMALALDGNYAKAISRRATLHEMVRDYEQAACDLRRLISVLKIQSNAKAKQSESPKGSNGGKESRQAQQRLLSAEDKAKKGTPLDFYLILGIKPDDTAADIKKAYHKAALRHHPDKAGQLLARSEVGDEGRVWKEISQEVHKDADRLFKMIGEAYAVLSDPAKHSEYDLEEEIRKASEQSNRGGTCRRSSDVYGNGRPSDGYKSPYDKTYYRRYGRDHWKTYGDSYSRW